MSDLRRRLLQHESERQRRPRELVVQDATGGRVWVLPEGQTRHLGRHARAELSWPDAQVSRKHCALTFTGEALRVENLSPRGSWLDGERLRAPGLAAPGACLRFGEEPRELRVLGVLDASAAPRGRDGALRLPQRLPPGVLLLRPLGRGAAGTVYEAWDEQAGARCAVKVLSAGGWAPPELAERFRREVDLQRRLRDYPGIVSMFELGTIAETGELYAVMELVEGQSLSRRLPGLSRLQGVRVLARVARAADYAHRHGLVHRDLKPANVMLGEGDVVRLTDFGVCKALEGDGQTRTGSTLGTAHYMAPEQIDDSKRVGTAADVWALGVILYQHLTGRLPFPGQDVCAVIDRVSAGVYAAPAQVDPRVPPELDELCRQALDPAPQRRPSAAAFAKALEAWVRGVDPPSRVSLISPGS